MQNERKIELGNSFPPLTKAVNGNILKSIPHYIIYNSDGATCTACGHNFGTEQLHIDFNDGTGAMCNTKYQLSHHNFGFCPDCGADVEYLALQHINRINPQYKNNIMVFLAHENRLYIRCYRLYAYINRDMSIRIELIERQRYVFCDEGAVRYRFDNGKWVPLTRVTEPVFKAFIYGWYRDESYMVINPDAINDTYAKYSALKIYEKYGGNFVIKYLLFWHKHKNIEYLLKGGFYKLALLAVDGGYGAKFIAWKHNDLRKMLGLNSAELKLLKKSDVTVSRYRSLRGDFPGYSPEILIALDEILCWQVGTFDKCIKATQLDQKAIIKYMLKQHRANKSITIIEYDDYLSECRQLEYDTTNRIINQPRDLMAAHQRTSSIIAELKEQADAEKLKVEQKANAKNIKLRQKMGFKNNTFFIRPAKDTAEIVREGKEQSHCVGGYAHRHNAGVLTIAFLRKNSAPDKPFYTMEISKDGDIVQTRGEHNAPMTDDVKAFVEEYSKHLKSIFKNERKRKTA